MLDKNINLNGKTILVTGAAGFIGANLCGMLLEKFKDVILVGIDSMNDYYDVSLKEYRLDQIKEVQKKSGGSFTFVKGNIADSKLINHLFCEYNPNLVVNLAAQAGVRYSIANPDAYVEANMTGFYNILEACRHSYDERKEGVEHFIYASSSSVYGNNKKIPSRSSKSPLN